MQSIFSDSTSFCTLYMDDIIIYSDSWEDHLEHIEMVQNKLRQAGLTANPAKCKWGCQTMEFLGRQVGDGRMMLPDHRAEARGNYSQPTTKKGLQAFLGAIDFYRRYVELLASQTAVQTLRAKQAPSKVVWMMEGEWTIKTICNTIASSCCLCIPLPQDTFSLVTDASGLVIGGVLQIQREKKWEAAAFHFRQLRGLEQRYSATELEAFALVSTIEQFGYYLYSRSFKVFTDHKPLVQLTTSERLNPRQRRLVFKLQHWMLDIEYLPGKNNTLADALSREARCQEKTPFDENPNVFLAREDVAV